MTSPFYRQIAPLSTPEIASPHTCGASPAFEPPVRWGRAGIPNGQSGAIRWRTWLLGQSIPTVRKTPARNPYDLSSPSGLSSDRTPTAPDGFSAASRRMALIIRMPRRIGAMEFSERDCRESATGSVEPVTSSNFQLVIVHVRGDDGVDRRQTFSNRTASIGGVDRRQNGVERNPVAVARRQPATDGVSLANINMPEWVIVTTEPRNTSCLT
jgi:hypothetical protein